MAESLPASRTPTARSGAIYTSADLLSKLIESETAHAIKPYQDALDVLQRRLEAQNNASVDQSTLELSALKAALEDSGLALVQSDAEGRSTLDFIGESGKLVAFLSAGMQRLSPNEKSPHITPATIVNVLVEGFTDCQRRLDEAYQQHPSVLQENADLKKLLEHQDAAAKAAAALLAGDVLKEQRKVSALAIGMTALRDQAQSLTASVVAARADSDDWKAKCEAAEAERDALKLLLSTTKGNLVSARSDLEIWKSKCLEAEADLKTSKDSEGNLRTVQAEGEKWKTKCLQLEADLKVVTEEKKQELANFRSELNDRTGKNLAAIANHKKEMDEIKKARDESNQKLRTSRAEVDEWKGKFLLAEANLKVAEDEKNASAHLQTFPQEDRMKLEEDLKAAKTELTDWEAKAVAWDTERNQCASQIARASTLISQFRSEVSNLKTRSQELEMERDSLKAAREADNALAFANKNALVAELEDLRKKHNPVATAAPKASSSMFIKSRPAAARTVLPNKPSSLPEKPSQLPPPIAPPHPAAPILATPFAPRRVVSSSSATTSTLKTPDQSSSPASTPTDHVGCLNGRVSIRKNVAASSSIPISSPVTSTAPRPPMSASGSNSKTVDPRKPPRLAQSSPAVPPPIFAGDGSDTDSFDVLGTTPGLSRLGGMGSRQSNSPSTLPTKSTATSSATGSTPKPKRAVGPRKPPQLAQSSPVVPPIVAAESSVLANFDALDTAPGLTQLKGIGKLQSNSPSTSFTQSAPAPSKASKPPSSKRFAEDAPESTPAAKKRAPLTPPSTSYGKTIPEYQESVNAFEAFDARRTKRPAPSPLVSERAKIPRVETPPEKPTQPRAAADSTTPSNPRRTAPSSRGPPGTFTRPPTVIHAPRSARQKASQT
ncbi:hypothetical protein C8R45DRAFT_994285 [Mycena sanguinolenta]|nr:hypothetical protein C8R45DRAFT_994285 [Mycena sanguinolenta]